jgi:predicted DNA-binding transcriptional regulator YafY
MPRHFSRHEQFLRIFALLEILSKTRQPLDDQALISQLKERLGLTRLSTRTLHRDCDFLLTCGYRVEHSQLPGDRRYGWQVVTEPNGRQIPAEPLTLLELVAFSVAQELLRSLGGTVLWTGMESLRGKIERCVAPELRQRLAEANQVFRVEGIDESRYASRPRLLSTVSAAIVDCREIEVEERADAGGAIRRRLQPHQLVIRMPEIHLVGFASDAAHDAEPVLVNIERIERVFPLDVTFTPRTLSGG